MQNTFFILKSKAQENYDSAELLKAQDKCNAAISRYYYSIYQRILCILCLTIDSDCRTYDIGVNSHIKTIEALSNVLMRDFTDDVFRHSFLHIIEKIKKVKNARKAADYKDQWFDKRQLMLYDATIVEVNNKLDELLVRYNERKESV